MLDRIFTGLRPLEVGLDASWLRSEVIQNNIANNDTPNFNRSDVQFETLYQDAIRRQQGGLTARKTMARHIDFGQRSGDYTPRVVEDTTTTQRMDGNNVDIDMETTDYARNYIYYQTLATKITGEFNQLRMAIREGK